MQIGLGITVPKMGILGGDAGVGLGVGFFPGNFFLTGAQGAWYDPSDFSTLFQNSTGTTPVTAVEQPVRLMLDRSRGLVLGSNIAPTITSESVGTGSISTVGGTTTVTSIDGSNYGLAKFAFSAVAGAAYEIKFTLSHISGVTFAYGFATGFAVQFLNTNLSTTGNYTFIGIASGASPNFTLQTASNQLGTFAISAISIKLLPGNHALAPNDASRPVLRARYNLLERSEEFDNAYWSKTRTSISANVGVAPDGTTTADKLIENTDTNTHTLFPNSALTLATTTSYTYSIYAKAAERTIIHLANNDLVGAFFNLSDGTVSDIAAGFTASITAAGSGWYRCVLTQALNSNASGRLVVRLVSTGTTTSYTGDGTSGILIWGAQLLTAADQSATGGAYQRIAAATDYDTSNPVWRPYLAFDGTDDSFGTSSIDFSGTDEVTMFAGVTKLSDANAAILLEASTNYSSNNGTFAVFAPAVGGQGRYYFYSRGTAEGAATSANTFAAPITNVVTALSDISGDSAVLRLNGTQAATSASDQGTGNFGNHALFIGRRNNTSLPLNGRLYGLTVLGRTATAAEIGAMEAWVNGKTGGY